MRVLHVIPGVNRASGGPASALIGMATAQAACGLDVSVLAGFRDGESDPNGRQLPGVALTVVGPCRGALLRADGMAERVAQAVAAADVVHVHGIWEDIQHYAARAARAAGVPYLVTPHGMLDRWSLRQKWLKKQLYLLWRGRRNLRNAAAVHCTSRAEAEQVEALRLGPASLVEPLGIDWSEFDPLPPRGTFRAAYPRLGDLPLIVFLGRVHPGKGVEHLIPALSACANRQAMLAVVGPDSRGYRGAMEALAASQGVGDRVLFTGMLRGSDRVAALADADLFALPSDHENFGVSVVEAVAAGTPVIISEHVNIQKEITDAGVGAVAGTDPIALARVLDEWLGDAPRRRAAAERARAFARSNYDWLEIARHWVERYALIGRGAASCPSSDTGRTVRA
jgi:glycosyltransferase involved in cell wall biosynthesis